MSTDHVIALSALAAIAGFYLGFYLGMAVAIYAHNHSLVPDGKSPGAEAGQTDGPGEEGA